MDGIQTLPSIGFYNDPDTGIWNQAANSIAISTSGTERMRINNLNQTLVRNGLLLAPAYSFIDDTATGIWSPGVGELAVSIAGTERLRINATGRVGIGTTSALNGAILDVRGNGVNMSSMIVPRDTTANRPTGVNGMIRYNTNNNILEAYGSNRWNNIAMGPGFVIKTADVTINNDATVNDDADLVFTAAPNTRYKIELILQLTCSNAAPDFRYTFSLPSGTMFLSGLSSGGNGAAHVVGASNTENVNNLPLANSGALQSIVISGYVTIGATGGAVQFRWSQFLSDANTITLVTGSIMYFTPMN